MDPLVQLVQRFCTEYLGPPNLAVAPQIFDPRYRLHVGGHELAGLDDAYLPVARRLFEDNPTFAITVHDLFTDGTWLAFRFSSSSTSLRRGARRAVWGGVILFTSNGHHLTEAWLEEDFFGRERQLRTGLPDELALSHPDPWVMVAEPGDLRTENAVRGWLCDGKMTGVPVLMDNALTSETVEQPVLDVASVTVNAMCAIENRAAFHVTQQGAYLGGLPGCAGAFGTWAQRNLAGIAEVEGHAVVEARVFSDRLDFSRRLLARRQM